MNFKNLSEARISELSIHPVRDKHIGLPGPGAVAVGAEHEFLAVACEHREAVELAMKSDLLHFAAVEVDQMQIKIAAA